MLCLKRKPFLTVTLTSDLRTMSIRCCLWNSGEDKYCLYIIDDLMQEFNRNPRLQNKFYWITEKEFADNRSHPVNITPAQKKEIAAAFDFIWGMSREIGVSKVDVKAVATALTLKVKLVSDDGGVQEISKLYDVDCISSLSLLKLMLDNGHIDLEKVRQTVAYWQFNKDTPKNFKQDYAALFEEDAPLPDYNGSD